MPCFLQDRRQKETAERNAKSKRLKEDAIHTSPFEEELDFLIKASAYCELSCCGWKAVGIDEDTFKYAINKIGTKKAYKVLSQMKENLERVGNHTGYVHCFHSYSEADEVREGYTEAITLLEKILADSSATHPYPKG